MTLLKSAGGPKTGKCSILGYDYELTEDKKIRQHPVVLFVLDNITKHEYKSLLTDWKAFLQSPGRKSEQQQWEDSEGEPELAGWFDEWNGGWWLTYDMS